MDYLVLMPKRELVPVLGLKVPELELVQDLEPVLELAFELVLVLQPVLGQEPPLKQFLGLEPTPKLEPRPSPKVLLLPLLYEHIHLLLDQSQCCCPQTQTTRQDLRFDNGEHGDEEIT